MLADFHIGLPEIHLRDFYAANFSYFNTLSYKDQSTFVDRCLHFIKEKTIVGADNFIITTHSRAMLAASAVQLTLGLETWDLNYFDDIIIYPEDFDVAGGLKYRGETNMLGYIKLSWKSFEHGYSESNDNLNLGLHEFSHALRFNSIRGHDQDYFIEHYFDGWLASAYEAYYAIKKNEQAIFRKYGGTNINEFLSVCIEHYFESPEDIKTHYPHLYFATALLLNQETANGKTNIGLRDVLFEKKALLLTDFSEHTFKTSIVGSNLFRILLVVLVPLVFNVLATGVFSGISFIFFNLCFLIYLRVDYKFARISLHEKLFVVQKGLLFFRWRKKMTIPASQLISVRALSEELMNEHWKFIYYNTENNYFYEEDVYTKSSDYQNFVKELLANKIGYYKS